MSMQFSVLASGSSGNASLLEVDGFGVLIDAGLGPRQMAARLAAVGASWRCVHALLLTHTHTDHWKDRTLAQLRRQRIPLYCHPDHHANLLEYSPSFAALKTANLVHTYAQDQEFRLGPALRCLALPLHHDGSVTSGFRFETPADGYGQACRLGYAADLGCWPRALAAQLADVDLLALEFNHDVAMEYASGRSPQLIARVLGDHGHLSNEQAADLLRAVLRLSEPGRLQHLVQLHLSRECNRPELAVAAARNVLEECAAGAAVHTAGQHQPGPSLRVGPHTRSGPHQHALRSRKKPAPSRTAVQPWLPGWEE